MSEKYYIGMDGGGTKVRGVALNPERVVAAEAIGGPANFQVIGIEHAAANIHGVVEAILEKLGVDFPKVAGICMGLAGAGRKDDSERMREGYIEMLRKKNLPIPNIFVVSDALAALEGAFAGEPGMILISGTGSILFAKEKDDIVHRVGGWGRIIGDEGSGYSIGRAALTAVARELDGRGKKTTVTELLKTKMRIDGPQSMIAEVYQKNLDIASLAPLVFESAEKGDAVAGEILARNVNELVEHVGAMLAKLKKSLPLVLIGGVLTSDNAFSRNLKREMADKHPEVLIHAPKFPPAVGAALISLRLGGTVK